MLTHHNNRMMKKRWSKMAHSPAKTVVAQRNLSNRQCPIEGVEHALAR